VEKSEVGEDEEGKLEPCAGGRRDDALEQGAELADEEKGKEDEGGKPRREPRECTDGGNGEERGVEKPEDRQGGAR